MGNSLLKNYDTLDQLCFGGDSYLKWKGIPACHKEGHNEKVTLFLFEKFRLEGQDILIQERILEILRQDCAYALKLRHPCILPIIQPINETASSLVFVAKPIVSTLTEFQGKFTEICYLLPVIHAGILDICEALSFMHRDAKLAHLNVSPSSILISSYGKWYLGSFGFTQNKDSKHSVFKELSTNRTFTQYKSLTLAIEPQNEYSSPELISGTLEESYASDIYSLGVLILDLLYCFILKKRSFPFFFSKMNTNRKSDKIQSKCFKIIDMMDCYGLTFQHFLRRMISSEPRNRPTVEEVLQQQFFNEADTINLRKIAKLSQCSMNEVQNVLIEFNPLLHNPSSIFHSESSLLKTCIMPVFYKIMDNYSTVHLCSIFLTTFFTLLQNINDILYFQDCAWCHIRTLMVAKQIKIQLISIIIDNLPFICTNLTDELISSDVVSFVIKCLAVTDTVILNKILDCVEIITKYFDSIILKTIVIPRFTMLVTQPETQLVCRIKVLRLIPKLSFSEDKSLIMDKILPAIEKGCNINSCPELLVVAGETLYHLFQDCDIQLGCQKILPLLISFLAEKNYTRFQYNQLINFIQNLIQKINEIREKEFAVEEPPIPRADFLSTENSNALYTYNTLNEVLSYPLNKNCGTAKKTLTEIHNALESSQTSINNFDSQFIFDFSSPSNNSLANNFNETFTGPVKSLYNPQSMDLLGNATLIDTYWTIPTEESPAKNDFIDSFSKELTFAFSSNR